MSPEIHSDLINDANGRALLERAARSVLTWDDYLELPLPSKMGARSTWAAVQSVRRTAGIGCPLKTEGTEDPWYGMTHELRELVVKVSTECHASFETWRMLSRSSDQHFLVGMRVADALASLELDGLDITTEEAQALIRHDKAPRGPAERLLRNTFGAMDALPSMASEPITVKTIDALYEMATEGIDVDQLSVRPRNVALSPLDLSVTPTERDDRYLEHIAAYVSGDIGDPFDPPALRCLLIEDLMYTHQPLGKTSGQVGRLLSDLYAIKHDLPVLAFLPMSKARLDWVEGRIAPPAVRCTRRTLDNMVEMAFSSDDADFTLHQTISMQLAALLLDELTAKIEAWSAQDAAMREMLKHEPELNQRQRSIIARAMRKPDASFSVKYHQTNHAISYSTARRDLVELEERGYLVMGYEGRAMVFKPGGRLGELSRSRRPISAGLIK